MKIIHKFVDCTLDKFRDNTHKIERKKFNTHESIMQCGTLNQRVATNEEWLNAYADY